MLFIESAAVCHIESDCFIFSLQVENKMLTSRYKVQRGFSAAVNREYSTTIFNLMLITTLTRQNYATVTHNSRRNSEHAFTSELLFCLRRKERQSLKFLSKQRFSSHLKTDGKNTQILEKLRYSMNTGID